MELQVCALSASRMQLADMYRASSSRPPTIIPPALTGSCFHNCMQGYCSTEDKSSLGAALSFFPSQNLQVPSHLPLPVGTPKPPPQLLHPTNRGRSCDPRLSAASLPRAHQGTVAFTAHIQNSTNHRHKPHCQKDHTQHPTQIGEGHPWKGHKTQQRRDPPRKSDTVSQPQDQHMLLLSKAPILLQNPDSSNSVSSQHKKRVSSQQN